VIKFRTLKYKNILSTGNVFTEIDLDGHGTTLIVGENGAGKSTFLDALSFALFGKPFRKINKPQLVNTITRKNLLVEVAFKIGSIDYRVVRGMKPNVFEVYQDGELINQSAAAKDYQEILEKQIIKANHRSFCQVVVLGSATFQPFMQLIPYHRREIIEDLLDLQIFTSMNTILKGKIQLNGDELSLCATERRVVEEKIKLIAEHIKQAQSSSDSLTDEKRTRIVEAQANIYELGKQYVEAIRRRRELADSLVDTDKIQKNLTKLNKLKYRIESNVDTLTKEVEFYREHDDCPTCKQSIAAEYKAAEIAAKEAEIIEMRDGLVKLDENVAAIEAELRAAASTANLVNSARLEEQKLEIRINSLKDYVAELEGEIEDIARVIDVAEDQARIVRLNEDLEAVKDKYNELSEEKRVLATTSALLKDDGIKSKIVKQYIPIINKLINKYLAAMDFFVSFELDEQFSETIRSRYRDEFTYASFSEGEKMRIDLAILFTWRAVSKLRNSINTNILIMDEVLDSSLDANGTEEFLKIINQLTGDTNTFIISHKTDQIVDKFSRVLTFEKYRNFSRVAVRS
jgi:DNA repair exonuclease SbcCD ATPase subunit